MFKEAEQLKENTVIVGDGVSFSLDDYTTKLNNNIVVCGSPGSGKTTGYVLPNIYQAYGSYIVADPKGAVYKKTANYLKRNGYDVKLLDLKNPINKNNSFYNPFHYINSIQDIRTLSSLLALHEKCERDMFWDRTAETLYNSLIYYLRFCTPERMQTFRNLCVLLEMMHIDDASEESELDLLFKKLEAQKPGSYAATEYKKVRCAPTRTLKSIIVTAESKISTLQNPELDTMTCKDNMNLSMTGDKKTAIFVTISDTDRSNDILANIFFTQAMHQLCNHADMECENQRLKYPVRFFLDDFATNMTISEFPRMISSIRSRNISASVIIQSEGQLDKIYGSDSDTILGSCDTWIYFGGNDLRTAKTFAERTGIPVEEVLYQDLGKVRVLRRGQKPIICEQFNMDKYKEYYKTKHKQCKIFHEIFH